MQVLPSAAPFIDGMLGVHRVQVEVELPPLIPGIYSADFWAGSHYNTTFDHVRQALTFEVIDSPSDNRSFPHTADHGFIVPVCRYEYSRETGPVEDKRQS
jgi:hypothetical protein